MKRICLTVFLTICSYVFLAIGDEKQQCFQFTWPGANNRNSEEFNCTDHNKGNPFTPCIEPLHFDVAKPNITELWSNINKYKKYIKQIEPGSVCVKYTYMYNGAVVNVSYFVGKVTIDQAIPVTSGCYVQYTQGYNIEVCACRPTDVKAMPCNSTIRNTCSTVIIFVVAVVLLFMYKIFHIP